MKWFDEEKDKQIKKFFKRYPKSKMVVFIFLLLVAGIWFGSLAVGAFMGKAPFQLLEEYRGQDDPSDFSRDNIKKWKGNENLIAIDEKNSIYKPKITSNFLGGRDIFFPESSNPNFNVKLRFTPKNEEKINLALNYGYLFRFIIGNGDYNQVQMQYNSRYPEKNLKKDDWVEVEEVNQEKWIKRNGRLEPKKQIELTVHSQAKYNSNKIFITISIVGLVEGESEKGERDFNYEIETGEKSEDFNEMLGIGLLDPSEEGIETELEEFKLNKL